ncbi:hypothetical protein SAMN04489762_2408 [Terribacillus saccharophilus]|uniref:Uncharacterized protein n=1 Tax=Terribacillus saccharophilus TaxID=361277 RepID=A0AAX2EH20_9BACI|nr:hypothetical protein SAMN04489762_2408 [Terribacillus saccharophilus]
MQIINKTWLSKEALEAEITVSDGAHNIMCFSQPFQYELGSNLDEPLYCFNVTELVRSKDNIPYVEKLNDHFSYRLTCKMHDKENQQVLLGKILLELDNDTIPGDILEDDFITFECQRIDIY